MMARLSLIFLLVVMLNACGYDGKQVTRIQNRVSEPFIAVEPGEHELGLGGLLWVNRKPEWKDGLLYIPKAAAAGRPLPLLIWLHGGGGHAEQYRYMFPIAEELGVVVLSLDARHNTWDGIDSPFGPDVLFIDKAMQHVFDRVHIDPERIALGGISDGAAYALAVGRSNGDVFSHLVAVAPGHLSPPSPPVGKPKIFVGHGTRDKVYHMTGSRYFIVPDLRDDGYDVTYLEFDGPHWVPAPVARDIMNWLKR